MFNAMNGSENDLVQVRKLKNYKVPDITEKRVPSQEKEKNWTKLLKKNKKHKRKLQTNQRGV